MSFCDFNHLIETKSQDGWVWRSSTFFCVAGKEKKKRVSYSDKQKEKNRLNLLRVFIWQTKGWILSWWWRCHHHCRCHRSNCRCRCHCRHRRRCRCRSCSHCRRMQFVCAQPWKMTPHILGRWWELRFAGMESASHEIIILPLKLRFGFLRWLIGSVVATVASDSEARRFKSCSKTRLSF